MGNAEAQEARINMRNLNEQFNPYPEEQWGEKFASEILDKEEHFPPPAEMLRPGEKVEAVNEEEIKKAVDKAEGAGRISKKMSEFLHTWSMRGLVLLTLMSSGVKPINPGGEDSEDEAIENVAENMRVELPEVVIYGHRDKETDELVNYLSSKEPLPEKKIHEIEAKVFLQRIESVCSAYEKSTPGVKDSLYSKQFREFAEHIKPKIDSLRKTDLAAYRESDDFKKDFLEWKFAMINKRVFDNHPIEARDLQSKLNYFKIYFASCGPVGFDLIYEHTKNLSEQEIWTRLLKEMPDYSGLSKNNFSVEQYDAVWTMHQEHGNPKVRITENFTPRFLKGERAYYYGGCNEMYLGIHGNKSPLDLGDWIAELSHSEQYWVKYSKEEMDERSKQDNVFLDSMSAIESQQLGTNPNSLPIDWETLKDKYLYDKEGSVEYEAHKIIEPELKKELDQRMKK